MKASTLASIRRQGEIAALVKEADDQAERLAKILHERSHSGYAGNTRKEIRDCLSNISLIMDAIDEVRYASAGASGDAEELADELADLAAPEESQEASEPTT